MVLSPCGDGLEGLDVGVAGGGKKDGGPNLLRSLFL